nr:DNA-directed RNA polymerase subunit beta like [Ipomoea batatas]
MEMEKDSDCEDYSALSFRSYLENGDEHDHEVVLDDNPWPPSQELFYFFSDFASAADRCGKIVRGGDAAVAERNEAREVDCFRSSSFSGKREAREVSLSSSPSQKVNISSLASMSAKSMRRTFIFGPLKFKPEMDLVAIKERQRRLSPKRVLPVATNAAGEGAENGGGKSERVQLTRCRTRNHLSTVLAKPFSCFTVTK